MNICEDRKKNDLCTDSFAMFESSCFVASEQNKLTQYSVCFTNPCINLSLPPSATCKYDHKVLEALDLLQCITAYFQCAQTPTAATNSIYYNRHFKALNSQHTIYNAISILRRHGRQTPRLQLGLAAVVGNLRHIWTSQRLRQTAVKL